jgi:hypothetical protein
MTASELMAELSKLPPETILFIYSHADRTYYDCFKLVPDVEDDGSGNLPEASIFLAYGASEEPGCTGCEKFEDDDD